ncbi:ABC transporter ATP-binding protein [Corynebacterium sp. SCR221107]|uniref:energy-coupling factor ABC transporter ATP-binding protein n=1 Tax=Corynebacterium sp. SCR221107 TaxID=3017361 RepID=UPI0022EC59B4|nr:ABC transporter ATP-binding protein [Corynebacterium sp. SCR221107]WBT07869.1 ABC transporter ATP-binding protein [Corynebacterium sp. SCR221107]
MSTVTFTGVNVAFDELQVLSNINLTLTERRIGIIGANGGGKSTLVRLINGLADPTSGSVSVDGLDVAAKGKEVRRKVGFVFSDAENQIVMPTVADDIAFSLRRMKLPKEEKKQRVAHMLKRFGLENHADHSPHQLSGGQKQLLALASVLILEPDLIIADEPTTLLDMINRRKISRVFAELDQQLIVVTHDLDFLTGFDRVLCIDDHHVVADGAPDEVIGYYEKLMESRA